MNLISPNTCNELFFGLKNLKMKTLLTTKVKKMHFSNQKYPSIFVIIFVIREVSVELRGSCLFLFKRKGERGIVLTREDRWREMVYKLIIDSFISNEFLCSCLSDEIIL